MTLKKYVIFDIDGTLADISHRTNFVGTYPKNHDAFYALIKDDVLIKPIADILALFVDSPKYDVVIVSGRSMDYLEDTKNWLLANHIKYDSLHLRSTNDFRHDHIIKQEILDDLIEQYGGNKPHMVFDDRRSVVEMWRNNGIQCLQVAPDWD